MTGAKGGATARAAATVAPAARRPGAPLALLAAVAWAPYPGWMPTFHDFTARTIDGTEKALRDFAGSPVLVVNVASRCGLTPQYEGLEALHRRFGPRGLVVVGFPCNDFAGQEPGSEAEIQSFCSTRYDVTFPLFSKLKVLGDEKHPLYAFLTQQDAPPKGPGDVSWNFEKFLVDRSGNVIGRFSPPTLPTDEALVAAVEKAL